MVRGWQQLFMHHRHQVLVEYFLFFVRDRKKTRICLIQFLGRQRKSEFLHPVAQTGTSCSRCKHNTAFPQTYIFGPHDLVCLPVLQKAVDMDTRTMGEALADDRLVRRKSWNSQTRQTAAPRARLPGFADERRPLRVFTHTQQREPRMQGRALHRCSLSIGVTWTPLPAIESGKTASTLFTLRAMSFSLQI